MIKRGLGTSSVRGGSSASLLVLAPRGDGDGHRGLLCRVILCRALLSSKVKRPEQRCVQHRSR